MAAAAAPASAPTPAFLIEAPAREDIDAAALIDTLAARHARRAERERQLELIPVRINTPGPSQAGAFFVGKALLTRPRDKGVSLANR